jgi:hypothetical protein
MCRGSDEVQTLLIITNERGTSPVFEIDLLISGAFGLPFCRQARRRRYGTTFIKLTA